MIKVPLAEEVRPSSLSDVVGQSHLIGKGKILTEIVKNKEPVNLILWGPPGTGKTTLARIIANETSADFIELSAVTAAKKDVVTVIEHARQNWNLNIRTILFVDEIHRFNKAQQDAFLPHVESGLITLIGATTENPSFEIINPLLSRSRVLVLEQLSNEEIIEVLERAVVARGKEKVVTGGAIEYIAKASSGDARSALGSLELALNLSPKKVTITSVQSAVLKKLPRYDKKGDAHYDIISAFIKSMRGSDEKAALYYLARMIQAGEDPKFIARRMVIFASEDIGLAGNGALSLAVATFQAVERVGLPEASYNLYHCATALARSAKSREVTDLMHTAQDMANSYPDSPVPLHVRNAPTKLMKDLGYGKGYKWKPGFKTAQGFLPEDIQS
jgi:putative ATPase